MWEDSGKKTGIRQKMIEKIIVKWQVKIIYVEV
jgi:hypothetical protein